MAVCVGSGGPIPIAQQRLLPERLPSCGVQIRQCYRWRLKLGEIDVEIDHTNQRPIGSLALPTFAAISVREAPRPR